MSQRTYVNKKIRKVIRHRYDERFDELAKMPFWKRLDWAWKVMRRKK